jgi:hypothetical protein
MQKMPAVALLRTIAVQTPVASLFLALVPFSKFGISIFRMI